MQSSTSVPNLPEPIGSARRPTKAYSPGQVAGAAFVGSPIAGCLLLASNFALFGMPESRRNSILWGSVATVALFAIALYLPADFPNSILPAAYVVALQQIASRTQGSLFESYIAGGGVKHSNWRVFGIGLACGVVIFLIVFALILAVPPELFPEVEI
ncbi:MAG: hypothetical protein JRH17_13240 [Deltaproteobacteria bacterium]|nr:hypothetical protein [Deltaproteobacteria bacterium]